MYRIVYITTLIFISFVACTSKEEKFKKKNLEKAFQYRPITESEIADYRKAILLKYDSILLRRGFNGSILIAKNGEILLEDYHGYSNMQTKDTLTATTPFHLASVSKTFTATAILKLCEEKKINLEDTIQVYFPAFPYHNISIRMLLNHRSGLPNYIYAMTKFPEWKHKLATNNDMLQFLIDKQPTWYGYPNRGFNYCNTNYALLALLIEKVTGQSYSKYLQDNIFSPLGMNHSFVFTINDSANYKPSYQPNNRPFPIESMDVIYGDKGIYSTVRDMFLWDKALYNHAIISDTTYEKAIAPSSFEHPGTHNYGMGWRLLTLPDGKIVFHNGWWHGNNNVFTRFIDDTATIIILGNKYNKAIYSGMKIGTVFKNSTKTEAQEPLDE